MTLRLQIQDFAHIDNVDIHFGDLTVLVGAQGTGKSLSLQWLKAALDGKQIVHALRDAGNTWSSESGLIDLIFGVGMARAWKDGESKVLLDGKNILPKNLRLRGTTSGEVLFVPGHRSMLISDGWAAPFQKLSPETPVIARLFSQALFDQFIDKKNDLFPLKNVLKSVYRDQINDAIYHGGIVALEDDQYRRRLSLKFGESSLSFMTWTAGQREFTPLLLGLYELFPTSKLRKHPDVDWVIIEEPEMGLHPQAITVFLLLVLEMLWRGYRVALSTHSPHVLTAVWMLQRLKKLKANPELLAEAFGLPRNTLSDVFKESLNKDFRVYHLGFNEDSIRSTDISSLDPGAESDVESDWGGLTGFSSKFGDVVRQAVNEDQHGN